jgi:type III secretory pathway component EscV
VDQITIASVLQVGVAFFQGHPELVALFLAVVIVSLVVSLVEIVVSKATG